MNEPASQLVARILSDFGWHADRKQAEQLANLFLPDGRLSLNGVEVVGRQAIVDDCRRRFAAQRTTRHVWSNLRIEAADENQIVSTAIQMTYEQEENSGITQVRISDLLDTFGRDGSSSWCFAHRVVTRVMTLGAPKQ
ncbi:MAG TPA: nuclear transport factor 2 family protein [Casimicrobiaceae bacterium]|nr:nuclear transport factor 2 family protein [Casimicrobiaceae bacterium]